MIFSEIIGFMEVLGKLKSTRRSGWVSQVGVKEAESVADHSFGCAFLAMIFSDLTELGVEKTLRMMLLHDVQEAITGDLDYETKAKVGADQVRQTQRRVIEELLRLLPPRLEEEYLSVWREYEQHISPEAILARDIDKIEMVLQAMEYEKQGYDTLKLEAFWDSARNQIETPIIREFLDALVERRKQG